MVSLSPSFKLLAQLALFSVTALAADVNYVFNIVNANISPDGFSRPAVLVNGAFPGTLIEATPADTLHVTVNNQLTDPLMRYASSSLPFER